MITEFTLSKPVIVRNNDAAMTRPETGIGSRSSRISGSMVTLIRLMIWLNIFLVAIKKFGSPILAFKKIKELKRLRDQYRNQQVLPKFYRSGKRYFVNYNTPGWPSTAFNRYVRHALNRFTSLDKPSLNTLVFAITKKCGFQCEHCCEWLNLNKPETLSKEELLLIIHRYHRLGIAQVQLSGGEPLNRLHDIYYLLDNSPKDIDFWLYTTGFSLTMEKAIQLKQHGLTGITISLDHYEEEKHDAFRGVSNSWYRALKAARYANDAGLCVCFSICATKQFISRPNLERYIELAKANGAAFVQILEPKAVGHYSGQDVTLKQQQIELLETFYETYNYNVSYASYPTITYHGYNSRRFGCSGSAVDYVYVDTDGDVHRCPFCQHKLFSAFDDDLPAKILQMRFRGCNTHNFCTTIK
jgi:MoaA/NifB/PqqE/SkfB family radical SAM enzyme